MKPIALTLVALTALAIVARAQTITYRASNDNGGFIELTGEKCTDAQYEGTLHARTSAADGSRYVAGCWLLQDGLVYVIWLDDHKAMSYDLRGFRKHVEKDI